MPKPLSVLCLFAAWLCASGAALDGVQVYAWGRMFLASVHRMPVEQAVGETLDGSRPCALCCALRRVRQQSHQPPATVASDVAKLILVAEEAAPLVFARDRAPWPLVVARPSPSRVDPVPLRPPRPRGAAQAV